MRAWRSTWRRRCARGCGARLRSARPAGSGGARHDRRPGPAGRREPHPGRRRPAAAVARASAPASRRWRARAELEGGRSPPHDVAFRLTPRLNAAGPPRARRSSRSICCWPATPTPSAWPGELDDQNTERQRIQELVWMEALAQATAQVEEDASAALVVGAEGWHPGVVGIIAARLVDRFGAAGDRASGSATGQGRGSARTVTGVNLYEALAACARAPDQVRRPRRRRRHEHRASARSTASGRAFAAEAARQLGARRPSPSVAGRRRGDAGRPRPAASPRSWRAWRRSASPTASRCSRSAG